MRAVTEMTAEQRTELEKLARSQKHFSGVEGMQAALELGKTGFNFEQIMGTLPGTLKLGLAGDIDAAKATDIATNVLTSLRLPMANAMQAANSMKRIGDVFSYVANKTNTDVEKLGETFKYVGNIGAATGQSLETLAALSGVMANVGIRGPEAGTALRSALVRMIKPTKPALGALSRLGINLGDFVTQSRTVGADGVLKTLQTRGIDASGAQADISRILADPKSKFDIAATTAKITDAIAKATGGAGAIDRDTIADGINEALLGAADRVDFTGFLLKLKQKGATAGDIANIFDQRQGSRLLSLLTGDLPSVIADIQKNAAGYIDRATELRLEGVVGAVKRLGAAYANLQVSLGKSGVIDTLASAFERMAAGLESVGKSAPALLRIGTYAALATVALGPLAYVSGVALRVLGPLATGLGALGVAATTGLAARLAGVATGVGAIALAIAAGLAGRLRVLAVGLTMLGSVGGLSAIMTALGASLLALGRSILMFPIVAVRALGGALMALMLNPVGIAITAIVTALTTLGVWVYNNWEGIKAFFAGFGEGLIKGLGPEASAGLKTVTDLLGTIFSTVSGLLGPLNATNAAWRSWGETLGGVVASAVNAVASGISKVVGLFSSAVEGAIKLKNAIMNLGGGGGGGTAGAPSLSDTGNVAGTRAFGGPVSFGKPYLVGERGPEIFWPSTAGRIEPNSTYRRLAADGVSASAASSVTNNSPRGGPTHVTHHWNISGVSDPREVVREIDRYMERMWTEQRGLLSD